MIDSCIKNDKQKIFIAPVKKKDAPNYYDVIRCPIDLTAMKNRAKRLEYFKLEELRADFQLLRSNAETYNGQQSIIGQLAREIEAHANKKLEEVENDVLSMEVVVQEKIAQGILKPNLNI